jgi:chromate reductase
VLYTHEAKEDMPMEGIVCISGTNRPDNYTARALGIVVDAFRHSHIDPLVFDARNLSLAFPGHPDPGDGERLRTAIAAAPGVILATPEYHGSFCAMTKLIIENLGFPSVLAGKPVALVGVAAGRIGAIKALEQLKSVCAHIGAIVVPGAVSVAGVQQVFDEQGGVRTLTWKACYAESLLRCLHSSKTMSVPSTSWRKWSAVVPNLGRPPCHERRQRSTIR